MYNALVAMVPDKDYATAFSTLNERIKELDSVVTKLCNNSSLPYFIIYHPALTYLARDYNLEQVAIEHEGKEPSAKHLATIIERARCDGMKRVFYQSEFPESSVAIVAEDIGAETVEINPLDENIFENIVEIWAVGVERLAQKMLVCGHLALQWGLNFAECYLIFVCHFGFSLHFGKQI